MESMALRDLVKKIFGDDQLRQQFASEPEKVISKFDLTEQEKTAVLAIQSGLVNGGSTQMEMAVRPSIGWMSPTQMDMAVKPNIGWMSPEP